MKKNKMMRLASGLLVAVLLTTSTISGTFAKYTTQDSGNDTARVAKWGVSLQVAGDLYGDTYKDTIIANNSVDPKITVQAADIAATDKNVVAPGTKNESGLSFGLTGKPEVDYQITATIISQNIFLKKGQYGLMVPVEVGKITAQNWSDELYVMDGDKYVPSTIYDSTKTYYTLEDEVNLTSDYYPVVYNLEGESTDVKSIGSITRDSLLDVASVIAKALNGEAVLATPSTNDISTYTFTSKEYDSNTDIALETVKLSNMSVTWSWAFENGNTEEEKSMYNGADTILGNLLAARNNASELEGVIVKLHTPSSYAPVEVVDENTDYCLDTQFSIDITVTQVD